MSPSGMTPPKVTAPWKIDGRRQVIYAKAELPLRDRIRAAQDIAGV